MHVHAAWRDSELVYVYLALPLAHAILYKVIEKMLTLVLFEQIVVFPEIVLVTVYAHSN